MAQYSSTKSPVTAVLKQDMKGERRGPYYGPRLSAPKSSPTVIGNSRYLIWWKSVSHCTSNKRVFNLIKIFHHFQRWKFVYKWCKIVMIDNDSEHQIFSNYKKCSDVSISFAACLKKYLCVVLIRFLTRPVMFISNFKSPLPQIPTLIHH